MIALNSFLHGRVANLNSRDVVYSDQMADIERALAFGIRDAVLKMFNYKAKMKGLDVYRGRAWLVEFERTKAIVVCQVWISMIRPRLTIPLSQRDGAFPIYVIDDAENITYGWSSRDCCYLRDLQQTLFGMMRPFSGVATRSRSPVCWSPPLVLPSPSPSPEMVDDEDMQLDDMQALDDRGKKIQPARTTRNARFILDD